MNSRHLIAFSLTASLLAAPHAQAQSQTTSDSPKISSPVELRLGMRKLWSDRAVWTHGYLAAAVNGAQDAQISANRLFQNDAEITQNLTAFFGESAARTIMQALHDQSSTLVALAGAAKISAGTLGTSAGDPTSMRQLLEQWHHSRDALDAALRTRTGERSDRLPEALQSYLSATMKELSAQVNNDARGDAEAFDAARNSAVEVADAVSDRLVAEFPGQLGATGTSGIR